MNRRILAAGAAALILAACGGGGGGNGVGSSSMMPEVTPPTTTEPAPQVTSADVQNANPASTISAAAQVGSSLPAFGSITQSANRDGVTGISTDRASTSFDADNFTLTISRQGDTPTVLSSVNDAYVAYPAEATSLDQLS